MAAVDASLALLGHPSLHLCAPSPDSMEHPGAVRGCRGPQLASPLPGLLPLASLTLKVVRGAEWEEEGTARLCHLPRREIPLISFYVFFLILHFYPLRIGVAQKTVAEAPGVSVGPQPRTCLNLRVEIRKPKPSTTSFVAGLTSVTKVTVIY